MPLIPNNETEQPAVGGCDESACSPHPLLDARRDSCAWREDEDGMPRTECGEIYVFEEGWKPHVRYCQGCGGVVWIPRENVTEHPLDTGAHETSPITEKTT